MADDPGRRPPPGHLRAFVLPLKATVVVAFVAMTVPVLLLVIDINYRASETVAYSNAVQLIERFRTTAIEEIVGKFDALAAIVEPAAELGHKQPDFFEDDRSLSYLLRVLQHSDTVLNFYVGMEDGAFRQARRIHDPDAPVHDALPPEGAKYAYRLVEPALGPPVLDRYVFLDADGAALGKVSAQSGYDPRRRAWYRAALDAGTTTITDPELFWAFGLVGFTLARPYSVDGEVRGVVAADVTLDGFSAYLARYPISDNSVSYLLDDRGFVLGASDATTRFGGDNAGVDLPHVSQIENRLAAFAYTSRPPDLSDGIYRFDWGGEDYIAGLSSFGDSFGKPWRLFTVTPASDFTGAFEAKDRRMVMIGLAAVIVQLVAVYVIASLITSPLQRMASKVKHIQSLRPSADLPPVRSRVREVATLGNALDTLDLAVQAFARFVPVSLVRQLIQSEQKLEIGGQSRFLTIFFSDVAGFSSLAERIASRELLARISKILEIVTREVHREHGTIDKFVGDGVMAFWGAPAPLEDHAFHACVAALRIQHELALLNEHWREEEAPQMRLRVGIHSDAVLVGNVGSQERMSYTVLGDGVNVAARLEDMNKAFGTLMCISQDTFREAGDRLCVRPIDEVTVKGRHARVIVYELLGAYGAGPEVAPSPQTEALAHATRSAFDAMLSGDAEGALARFRKVLAMCPDDPVAKLHIARLGPCEDRPADGVVVAHGS